MKSASKEARHHSRAADHGDGRRRWTPEEKVRIIEESFVGHRQASVTARRYGIATSVLFNWRKAYREERIGGSMPDVDFVEAVIVPDVGTPPPACGGRMEIIVQGGRRLIVGPDVDSAALARVLAVLEER